MQRNFDSENIFSDFITNVCPDSAPGGFNETTANQKQSPMDEERADAYVGDAWLKLEFFQYF